MRSFSKFTSGSKKFQKLLWVLRPSKPIIDFLEMTTPMGGFLCLLLRLDVNRPLRWIGFSETTQCLTSPYLSRFACHHKNEVPRGIQSTKVEAERFKSAFKSNKTVKGSGLFRLSCWYTRPLRSLYKPLFLSWMRSQKLSL